MSMMPGTKRFNSYRRQKYPCPKCGREIAAKGTWVTAEDEKQGVKLRKHKCNRISENERTA